MGQKGMDMDRMELGSVTNASYEETGGGCYTYWGKMSNGQYFVFGLNNLAILDADYGETMTEAFFNETEGDTTEWEKAHTIEVMQYPSEGADRIIEETFDILIHENEARRMMLEHLRAAETGKGR